jgi:PAS domain S-box-containing protein
MKPLLRLLQVEDSESDAALIVRVLQRAGFAVESKQVESASAMREALSGQPWDAIVADYHVPQFEAPASLRTLQSTGFDIPFIVVSGAMGTELAVAMMKAGAHDYLMKDDLARLAPAVEREIREAVIRQQRRQAEETLRTTLAEVERSHRLLDAVFTAQTDGALVCDANGVVLRTNPAGAIFFGFDPTGLPIEEVVEKFKIAGGRESSTTLRALRGETIVQAEQTAGDRTIESTSVPMRDEAGRIIGAVTFARDISERKRSEERLRQSQKLESIGRLAGGIAHDFNNILTVVGGNIALAMDDACPDCDAGAILTVALDSVKRAAGLTRQLLAYAGKGAFVREHVSVSAAAESAAQMMRPSIPRNIQFDSDLALDLPTILTDPQQIEQIFVSLLQNAVEAIGSAHGGTITVRTGWLDGSVVIEVADSGCGMDGETRSAMFDPFFTTKFLGRGLGLAAVDGIVRSLNGQISVDTKMGQGTCVRILLPVRAIPERGEVSTANPDVRRSGSAVLIVDDEPQIRKMAAAILKKQDIAVVEASTGKEALERLLTPGPDIRVVLLDMAMPEMTGEEALPSIRQLRPDVRVIVSSGYSDAEVKHHFDPLAVHGFLAKPYTSQQLLAQILPALGRPEPPSGETQGKVCAP